MGGTPASVGLMMVLCAAVVLALSVSTTDRSRKMLVCSDWNEQTELGRPQGED